MRSVWLAFSLLACAHEGKTIILSVRGMDCYDCAEKIIPQIKQQPGVHDAKFDRVKVEVVVEAAPNVAPESLVAVVEKAGFQASVGPGRGAYLPAPAYPVGADVQIVSKAGEDVPKLDAILATGKATVVDFYADWCGPCHEVDEHLAKLLAARRDVAVRKINIVDWNTPVAKHHLGGATEIPYALVFDRQGKQVAVVAGFDLAKLDAAIETATR